MAKQPRDQVEDKPLAEYVPPGGDAAAEELRFPDDSAPPSPEDLNSYRVILGCDPDVRLAMFDFSGLRSVPPGKALGVVVRCLERVWPLVAWHPVFGDHVRKALETGVRCDRGEKLPSASVRDDWVHLATFLRDSLNDDAVELRIGTGQAVLVALGVLEAVHALTEERPWNGYGAVARDASAAIGARSHPSLRTRDLQRFTAAVTHDVRVLTLPDMPGGTAPAVPGNTESLGQLWVDGMPHVIQIANPPQVIAAELTLRTESPNLAHVPTSQPTNQIDPPVADPLTSLSVPEQPLTPEAAVVALGRLVTTVRNEHAPHINEFRRILKALAHHTFPTREDTARVIQQLQAARTLLGVGFVLVSDDTEKNGVRVSLVLDTDARYATGLVRAVRSAKPQEKLHSKVSLPVLDVIDLGGEI